MLHLKKLVHLLQDADTCWLAQQSLTGTSLDQPLPLPGEGGVSMSGRGLARKCAANAVDPPRWHLLLALTTLEAPVEVGAGETSGVDHLQSSSTATDAE